MTAELVKAWRSCFPRRDTFIYAIQAGDDGPVKLGTSQRPWERIATLQTASWTRLRGIAVWYGSAAEERAIHQLFAEQRLEGEWFQPSEELVAFVDLLGGGPSCDFYRPEVCFQGADEDPGAGVCDACGMEFFA